jgi:uncharacterized membrane protein YkoI
MTKVKILLVVTCMALLVGAVSADDDHLEARRLVEEGTIRPLEEILEGVENKQPGRILEVELEKEHGRYIYEIELLDDQGKVWEMEIDAENGEILKTELED